MAGSQLSTPKRKQSEMLADSIPKLDTTTQFTFKLNSTIDDGSISPRTRVAHTFKGLALESGDRGGGDRRSTPMDLSATDVDNQDGPRKRCKVPDVDMPDADINIGAADETIIIPDDQITQPHKLKGIPRKRHQPRSISFALDDAVIGQTDMSPTSAAAANTLSPPHSPQQNPSAKPCNRQRQSQRNGTPPPFAARSPSPPPSSSFSSSSSSSSSNTITDPLRASLTWHEDEITIYDPDDSDDDGTGINGIGFKPTPAIAYARAMRRRQQLAEYKKREDREARAKRSLRRRMMAGGTPSPGLGPGTGSGPGKKERERRKVRFLVREMEREREAGAGGGGELVEAS
ncbi:hypothetical protein VTK26DRAFT_5727 [Humicola hyalothermophila]